MEARTILGVCDGLSHWENTMTTSKGTRTLAGKIIAGSTLTGRLERSVAGSDLSSSKKADMVKRAVSSASKKTGTFKGKNAK